MTYPNGLSAVLVVSPLKNKSMGIRNSIGFMIFLIVVRVAMPDVFHAVESTLLKFFGLVGDVFATKPQDLFNMASVNNSVQSLVPRY